uniref:Invasion associated locus B family protein n=1 Tax=OCS116 cluster bacterium TaxID=2030921 RepID=A0A2A4Z4Z8_9PROT
MTNKYFGNLKAISTLCVSTFVAAATLLIATPTFADDPKPVSQHKDWTVFAYEEGGKKTCFAVTQPTESLPKGVRRGSIFFSVTHSQTDKTVNAVSIAMGYPLRENSTPTVTIGGKVYSMFAQAETAWPAGDSVQTALVAAMKRGQKMSIKGTSSRGTNTTDNYSLSGITAAIGAAKTHCGL